MAELRRLSLSLEGDLADELERMVLEAGYQNRSEFIRDLIRDRMVSDQWQEADEQAQVLGTISLVYNHHQRELSEKLTDIQHEVHDMIQAATHVHLTHELCAEMIMVRGSIEKIDALSNALRQQKGVVHAALNKALIPE